MGAGRSRGPGQRPGKDSSFLVFSSKRSRSMYGARATAFCAKWASVLLLAATMSSCASISLHEWATEEAPRSEVIGFVDAHGNGDLLLVKLEGEDRYPDGMYELSVFANADAKFSAQQVAPRKLCDARVSELRRAKSASSSVAHLDCTEKCNPSGWWAVDGYELAGGVLRRIETTPRRYFVFVGTQIAASVEIGPLTKLRIHAPDSSDGPGKLRGIAYLPPARPSTARVVAGIIAAPFAVAADIVTLPVQFLAALGLYAWWSNHSPIFSGSRHGFEILVLRYRRWFKKHDPESPVLMGLSAAALSHPQSLVVVSFSPLVRSLASGFFHMLRIEDLQHESVVKAKTKASPAQR